MVMKKSIAVGSIVTGIIILGCAFIAVICGAVAFHKLSGEAAASAGLWSLYFILPGVLSVVAGWRKHAVAMGFALGLNIIGVILSGIATIVLIIFISVMNDISSYSEKCYSYLDRCTCTRNDGQIVYWKMNCDDVETLYSLMVAMLILYVILTITTFIASIYGCLGTCCASPEPVVIVTPGMPMQTVGGGGTIVLASNQTTMVPGYPGQMMPAVSGQAPPHGYGGMAPPAYTENTVDVGGKKMGVPGM